MAEPVVYRRATSQDYDAVLGLYQYDLDYIPAMYHKLIKDKDTYVCLVEKEGRVIGMTVRCLCFGGSAAWGIAARVHPKYQHQGISLKLNEYMDKLYARLYPKLEKTVFTGKEQPYFLDRIESGAYTLLSREGTVCMSINTSKLKQNLLKYNKEHLPLSQELRKDGINSINISTVLSNKVFQTTCCYKLHQPSHEGIREAMQTSQTTVTKTPKEEIDSIGFFDHITCKFGQYAFHSLYGSNMDSLKSLIVNQIFEGVQKMPVCKLVIHVVFPEKIKTEDIFNFMKESLGFDPGYPPEQFYSLLMCKPIIPISNI